MVHHNTLPAIVITHIGQERSHLHIVYLLFACCLEGGRGYVLSITKRKDLEYVNGLKKPERLARSGTRRASRATGVQRGCQHPILRRSSRRVIDRDSRMAGHRCRRERARKCAELGGQGAGDHHHHGNHSVEGRKTACLSGHHGHDKGGPWHRHR
jgi:hypothetical protein